MLDKTIYNPVDFPNESLFTEWSNPQDGKNAQALRKMLETIIVPERNEGSGVTEYPNYPAHHKDAYHDLGVFAYEHYGVLIVGDLYNTIARMSGIERAPEHNSVLALMNFTARNKDNQKCTYEPGLYVNDVHGEHKYEDNSSALEKFKKSVTEIFRVTEIYSADETLQPNLRFRGKSETLLVPDMFSLIDEKRLAECHGFPDRKVQYCLVQALENFLSHPEADKILENYAEYVSSGKMRSQGDHYLYRNVMPVQFSSHKECSYEVIRDARSEINLHQITLSDEVRDKLYQLIESKKADIKDFHQPGISFLMEKPEAEEILKPLVESVALKGVNLKDIINQATTSNTEVLQFHNLPIDRDIYKMKVETRQSKLEQGVQDTLPIEHMLVNALTSYADEVVTSHLDDDGRKASHQGLMNRSIGAAQSSVGSGKFGTHSDGCHVAIRHNALFLMFEYGNEKYETTISNGKKAYDCLPLDSKNILSEKIYEFHSGTTSTGEKNTYTDSMVSEVDGKFKLRVNFESSRYTILAEGEKLEKAQKAISELSHLLDEFSVSVSSKRGDGILFNNDSNGHGRKVRDNEVSSAPAAVRIFKRFGISTKDTALERAKNTERKATGEESWQELAIESSKTGWFNKFLR